MSSFFLIACPFFFSFPFFLAVLLFVSSFSSPTSSSAGAPNFVFVSSSLARNMYNVTYPGETTTRKCARPLPPLNETAPALLFEASLPHRQSTVAATDTRSISRSYSTSGNPLGKRARSPVSPEKVMEMNREAMALLNDGKMKASHAKLQTALKTAEMGVRKLQGDSSMSSAGGVQDGREEWLLAFATTLSNLGCLQRRENRLDDALRYLHDARNVELQVFGKPSCSTMLNLSAVLLGMGSVDEALDVARDCVTSSENGDPMLHIVALHNYGVALSNHPAEQMQQSSAPLLMKALRLSEHHLGYKHSTTSLIRQRCGMTLQATPDAVDATVTLNESNKKKKNSSIAIQPRKYDVTVPVATTSRGSLKNTPNSRKAKKSNEIGKQSSVSQVLPPIAPQPGLDQRQRAKQVLGALDYGLIPNSLVSAGTHERSTESPSLHASSRELLTSVTLRPSLMLPPHTKSSCVQSEGGVQVPESSISSNIPVDVCSQYLQEFSLHGSSINESVVPIFQSSLNEELLEDSKNVSNADTGPDDNNSGKLETIGVSNESVFDVTMRPCVDGQTRTNIFCASRSMEYSDEMGYDDENRVEEEGETRHPHTGSLEETRKGTKPNFPGFYITINSWEDQVRSSFLRFAQPLSSSAAFATTNLQNEAKDAVSVNNATIGGGKPSGFGRGVTEAQTHFLHDHNAAAADDDEDDDDEKEEEGVVQGQTYKMGTIPTNVAVDSSGKLRDAFVKIIGVNPVTRRMQRIQIEREEEAALRSRLLREAEEREQKEYFERTLNAIKARTRDRAATKIQYTWSMWWNTVGRRRRELLRRRAEERERRERLRQALLEHEQRVEGVFLERERKKKKPQESSETMVIPAVLRCGKKWLEKTACVRYCTRRGIPRGDHKNAFFFEKIAKVQATWRGVYTRQQVRELLAAQVQMRTWKLKAEPEEYAALTIQMFVRRFFARKARNCNAIERYGPPATRIQRWFRLTMSFRRALGIDRVTKWRMEYSARLIQRTWRAYLRRLADYMARLRYQLNEDRRRETAAAEQLQRIGRGCISRCCTGRYFVRNARLQREMYKIQCGACADDEEVDGDNRVATTATAAPPLKTVYVPTPAKEVAAVFELEREKFHIGVFVETVAERERAEWAEALRLRPFEVLRRRAQEDHLCEIELNTFRRERAAVKIQKEFRRWLRVRHEPARDKTLLLISRGIYQQDYYQRKIEKVVHRREQESGRAIFGDQTAPMREMRAQAQEELIKTRSLVRTHLPFDGVRTRAERREAEMNLRRDEKLVKRQIHDETSARQRASGYVDV